MERRRIVVKLLIKHSITDFPKCRRAADAPSLTGFAKVSDCFHFVNQFARARQLRIFTRNTWSWSEQIDAEQASGLRELLTFFLFDESSYTAIQKLDLRENTPDNLDVLLRFPFLSIIKRPDGALRVHCAVFYLYDRSDFSRQTGNALKRAAKQQFRQGMKWVYGEKGSLKSVFYAADKPEHKMYSKPK